MNIQEFQRWFAGYDQARALDLVEPSQVTVHLMEEVGEIAREVLYLEGYRDPSQRSDPVEKLSSEIGDALVFLTKIALHYGIDLESVMQNVVAKAERRWPPEEAHREMERYIEQQRASTAQRVSAWEQRNAAQTGNRPPSARRQSEIENRESKSRG